MRARHWMQIAALASAIGASGTALAADAGSTVKQMQQNPSPNAGASQGAMSAAPNSVGGSERMDNSNPAGFDAWMRDYATSHNGRITRDEYMRQMGQRWDAIDAQRQGYLTPDQAHGIYWNEQAGRPPRTGSEVTPGYTGPGSVKGK
jgi:hypothetical protein